MVPEPGQDVVSGPAGPFPTAQVGTKGLGRFRTGMGMGDASRQQQATHSELAAVGRMGMSTKPAKISADTNAEWFWWVNVIPKGRPSNAFKLTLCRGLFANDSLRGREPVGTGLKARPACQTANTRPQKSVSIIQRESGPVSPIKKGQAWLCSSFAPAPAGFWSEPRPASPLIGTRHRTTS